eukprot:3639346-Rhodomonas_salina.1
MCMTGHRPPFATLTQVHQYEPTIVVHPPQPIGWGNCVPREGMANGSSPSLNHDHVSDSASDLAASESLPWSGPQALSLGQPEPGLRVTRPGHGAAASLSQPQAQAASAQARAEWVLEIQLPRSLSCAA